MLDLVNLKISGFFKEKVLKVNEVLFKQGDFDENIYIIEYGEFKVEKYTTKYKTETKILAHIGRYEVFGEAAFENEKKEKEVSLIATKKTKVLYINAKDGFDSFSKNYPSLSTNLLKYIISLGNKRLNYSNDLITATYKINTEILKLDNATNKEIFEILEDTKEMIDIDHIIYYEQHPSITDFVILRYDTRKKGKMMDEIIEITEKKVNDLKNKIPDCYNFMKRLKILSMNMGYLVFFRKAGDFSENDKKVLSNISSSISGLVKQKQLSEADKNIQYINN